MFLVGILSWWYGSGLVERVGIAVNRLKISSDYFSIGLLFRSLFSPYRQISAGEVVGSLSDKIHAFFDRLLSRFIGAFVRTGVIIIGLSTMLMQFMFGFLILIMWVIIPFMPVAGLIVWVIGWLPV
jgi:hypothetical protein